MTTAWRQGARGHLAKGFVAALVIAVVSVAGLSAPGIDAAGANRGVNSLGAARARTGSAVGDVTMWCTTSNSYVDPALLDLLAPQFQSGPVQTVTCIPATVGEDGAVTELSVCTVGNTYTNPGVLDLLGPQVQSGPFQTMACVPAAAGGGGSGGGGVTVLSACTVTNSSTHPGLLGLLAPQFQSGPVQTVTCVPAAVVATTNDVVGGSAADPAAASRSPRATATGDSTLAATGPARSLVAVRTLSGLLIGLGLLGLRITRAAT